MPFELASKSIPRAKIFIYGESGTGKTSFPLKWSELGGKLAYIDLEGGTNRYDNEFKFYRWNPIPTSIEEILSILDFLGTKDHDFTTIVIDPLTIVYDLTLLYWDKIFLRTREKKKGHHGDFYEVQPLDYKLINRFWSRIFLRLRNMDLNVICTARSKTLYDTSSEVMMKSIGKTFDSQKSTDYEFDTVFSSTRIKETDQYILYTDKHRSFYNKMPVSIDWTGANMDFFKKYYGESITRKAIPIQYITQEIKQKIELLLNTLGVTEEKKYAALNQWGVSQIDDLLLDSANEIVLKLENKLAKVTPF